MQLQHLAAILKPGLIYRIKILSAAVSGQFNNDVSLGFGREYLNNLVLVLREVVDGVVDLRVLQVEGRV